MLPILHRLPPPPWFPSHTDCSCCSPLLHTALHDPISHRMLLLSLHTNCCLCHLSQTAPYAPISLKDCFLYPSLIHIVPYASISYRLLPLPPTFTDCILCPPLILLLIPPSAKTVPLSTQTVFLPTQTMLCRHSADA